MKTSAQSTLEFMILLGVIVAALLVMQVYIKRGYQGKLREAALQLSEQGYSPGLTIGKYNSLSTISETSNTYSFKDPSDHALSNSTTNYISTDSSIRTEEVFNYELEPGRW